MKTIEKFSIPISTGLPGIALSIDKDSECFLIEKQGDEICLWFCVPVVPDLVRYKEIKKFIILGKGDEVQDTYFYLGSVKNTVGSTSYHIFEIQEEQS